MYSKILMTAVMLLTITLGQSQSSRGILSGGWATMHPKDTDNTYDGFKIGVQGESIKGNGNFAVGGSLSYLDFKYDEDSIGVSTTNKYHSYPININAKFLVGKNKIQGYIKGLAGFHFATLKAESQNAEVKTKEAGWSYGYGAGIIFNMSESTFLNFDWEADYLTSNSDLYTAITNSFSIGIGKNL